MGQQNMEALAEAYRQVAAQAHEAAEAFIRLTELFRTLEKDA
jgi:uncharacterized protein YukE